MIERVSRTFALVLAACILLLTYSVRQASAQTYNFSFSGSTWGISSGSVTFSGISITSITGNFSGLANQGIATGTQTFATFGVNSAKLVSATDYYFDVSLNNSNSNAPELFFGDGNSFSTYCGGNSCNNNGGTLQSGVDLLGTPGGSGTQIVTALCGTACALTAASPAPVPGAGTLSWLVLGLGVVIVRRKAISAMLRSAYSRIAGRASA